MQKKTSGRSLAVRVGALTAAVTLMLAGGVAMASSASAANDKNPDKGNSSNAPGQQSANGSNGATTNNPNGGANHGDNGGTNTPGNNQNGNNGNGGTGHLAIDVCHATRSASNPYVFITVDFSSVDEAWLYLTGAGKGNGHGDHVGMIWDGQRSGVNWGDIIGLPYPIAADSPLKAYTGYNLGATSVALGGTGAEILANGCNPLKPLTDSISGCYTLTSANPAAFGPQTFSGTVGDEANWVNSANQSISLFTKSANAASTDPTIGCGTPQTCEQAGNCPGDVEASAAPSSPICRVVDGKYNGVGSVQADLVSKKAATQQAAQDAADLVAEEDLVNKLNAEATGDNILKPFTGRFKSFAGYNWTTETQARMEQGNCSEVLSVITAVPLAGTVAPASGNPKPAKVPASATLPGSVPAGDGSQVPALPLWALAMVVVGAIGAAAAGSQILGNRK